MQTYARYATESEAVTVTLGETEVLLRSQGEHPAFPGVLALEGERACLEAMPACGPGRRRPSGRTG